MMEKKNKIYLIGYAILVFVTPAFLGNNYYLMVLNVAAVNVIMVLGLNLLMGYAGQISLGHAAFFGLGAYLSGILTATCGFPPWPTVFLALLITGAVAYAIGIPTLKLEGHYLVMATLGFNVIVYIVMIQFDRVTGGPSGFPGIPHLRIGGFVFNSDRRMYYLLWSISMGVLILSMNLIRSRVGRAMAALSHNEVAAMCSGIDTEKYKIGIFVMSAMLASLAGSLYAHYITFVSPGTFSIFFSLQLITMVLVGGMGSLWGSVFGALLLTVLPELLHGVKEYNVLIYGLVLMVVIIFFPQGLFPGMLQVRGKRRVAALTEAARMRKEAP